MRRRWLLASGNAHKVREIRAILEKREIALDDLAAVVQAPTVVEDGATFLDNARKKAWTLARFTGLVTLADDSGLEVAALQGAPGVHSARFAGENLPAGVNAPDAANNAKLLRLLQTVAPEERSAAFRCTLVLADPRSSAEFVFEGVCEGVVLSAARGGGGFGYDPLFWIPSLQKTMAELTMDEKNKISHRAQALAQLEARLPEILSKI